MNNESKILNVSIDKIIPNRFQPRLIFDEKSLNELSESIKEHGIIQPLIVRPIKDGGFEIISGHTRKKVAMECGIEEVKYELLPDHKVEAVESLGEHVAFIGDGINDAPVLARSSVGISMGGLGSDAAIEASDIVLMDDKLDKVATAIDIAKFTKKIIMQNIIFSLGIKVIVMILSVLGKSSMWLGVFADVGVAIIAVMNSLRILRHQS